MISLKPFSGAATRALRSRSFHAGAGAFSPLSAARASAISRPAPPVRWDSNDAARPPSATSDFNELRERSLLRHVISSSTEGDPASVLDAMDVFWDTYFNGAGTAEWKLRSQAIDRAVEEVHAKRGPEAYVMELGTYCGYTAVRMGRLLPPGAKLVSVEIEPLFAAIASTVVEHAGLRDRVEVRIGSVADRLPSIQAKHGARPLDAVLLDHSIKDFLPDLRLLESNGMINSDTAVLCDWNLYPGTQDGRDEAPQAGTEFMDYLKKIVSDQDITTTKHSVGDKDVFTVSTWSGVV
mmetsp:Transcript_35534/g.105363  ORF Transcript_35534/g.105363 Transcript_35534/m.105363 type:complete len:294 (+) Transcript_35534:48-929(+)